MKLTTFLAAVAGLECVSTSPTLTPSLAPNPIHKAPALVSWKPINAYDAQKGRKDLWASICGKALDSHGCASGVVHQGSHKEMGPDGKRTGRTYHNVEEVSLGPGHTPKKLRVFLDGSAEDLTESGWSEHDLESMAKFQRKSYLRNKKMQQFPETKSPTEFSWSKEAGSSEDVSNDGLSEQEKKSTARAKRKNRMLLLQAKRQKVAEKPIPRPFQEADEGARSRRKRKGIVPVQSEFDPTWRLFWPDSEPRLDWF